MSVNTVSVLGIDQYDKILVIVPMFHANAWGTPYAGWMAGSDFVMPQRFLQAEPLTRLIALERPTLSARVPTIWNDVLQFGQQHEIELSSLRMVTAGGSAVPRSLMEKFQDRFGVRMIQGWGMTETSPVCALAYPPKGTDPADDLKWRARTGRVLPGVELRIVAEDGTVLANDGRSLGEIEVRGTPGELREWLASRVAKWWLPERWAFIDEIPKTSVGKFDKTALRARQQAGELEIQVVDAPAR
jgi:fatty-acyl-CoA synthase